MDIFDRYLCGYSSTFQLRWQLRQYKYPARENGLGCEARFCPQSVQRRY